MAKDSDFALAPLILQRVKEDQETIDFTISLDGPFDVTNFLTAWQREAGMKGCFVMIQVRLLPSEGLFDTPDEGETEFESE